MMMHGAGVVGYDTRYNGLVGLGWSQAGQIIAQLSGRFVMHVHDVHSDASSIVEVLCILVRVIFLITITTSWNHH